MKVSVPLGKPIVLSASVQPSSTQHAATEIVVLMDGKELMRFTDRSRAPGPAVALRSYDVAVTYSELKITPAAMPGSSHGHGHGHGHKHTALFAPGSNKGMMVHGVNNGEALKEGAVRYRLSHAVKDATSSHTRMELLDRYHGAASGIFSCDEHLAGLHPSHGTELCTVVEAMYSEHRHTPHFH